MLLAGLLATLAAPLTNTVRLSDAVSRRGAPVAAPQCLYALFVGILEKDAQRSTLRAFLASRKASQETPRAANWEDVGADIGRLAKNKPLADPQSSLQRTGDVELPKGAAAAESADVIVGNKGEEPALSTITM